MADLRALQREPVPCAAAAPLDDNIYEWHATLLGPEDTPYEGGVFHLALLFPCNYPHERPKVRLLTPFPHPHVIGDRICLDLLGDYQAYFEDDLDATGRTEGHGWSSAYTVSTILVQMEAFLMELDHVDPEKLSQYLVQVPGAKEHARAFECDGCPHKGTEPWPEVENAYVEDVDALYESLFRSQEPAKVMDLSQLSGEVLSLGTVESESSELSFSTSDTSLSPRSFASTESGHSEWSLSLSSEDMRVSRSAWPIDWTEEVVSERTIMEELTCYHSKLTYKEDCMGFGLLIEKGARRPPQSLKWINATNSSGSGGRTPATADDTVAGSEKPGALRRTAGDALSAVWPAAKEGESQAVSTITKITCRFDVLSYTAFHEDRVRHGVMNQRLTHWLPLYINATHAQKSASLVEKSISTICTGKADRFEPLLVLRVLPKIMCNMVVDMMSDTLHTSSKALTGYCAVHRLLLMFAQEYPEIVSVSNDIISHFVSHERNRHKQFVPNLGEFLPLLTIADYAWQDVREAYVAEYFDRSVLWLVKKYPQFKKQWPDPAVDKRRAEKSFEGTRVGSRLLLFNVHFLQLVARPEECSLAEIAARYDRTCGIPSDELKDRLSSLCQSIKAVSTWPEFYTAIGGDVPSKQQMLQLLIQAVRNSERKGYHQARTAGKRSDSRANDARGKQSRRTRTARRN